MGSLRTRFRHAVSPMQPLCDNHSSSFETEPWSRAADEANLDATTATAHAGGLRVVHHSVMSVEGGLREVHSVMSFVEVDVGVQYAVRVVRCTLVLIDY
jgi:hypothetical protein